MVLQRENVSSRAERPEGAESRDPPRAEWRGPRAAMPPRARVEGKREAAHPTRDSARARLCIRRQFTRQTVHLTTGRRSKGRLVVVGGTVWLAGCRRRHSLSCSDTVWEWYSVCWDGELAPLGGLRMVFRLLGWSAASAHPSKRNTILIRLSCGPSPSQRTKYRSQTPCQSARPSQQTEYRSHARPGAARDSESRPPAGLRRAGDPSTPLACARCAQDGMRGGPSSPLRPG